MTAPIRLDQQRFAKALQGVPARYPLFVDGRAEEAADGRVLDRIPRAEKSLRGRMTGLV